MEEFFNSYGAHSLEEDKVDVFTTKAAPK